MKTAMLEVELSRIKKDFQKLCSELHPLSLKILKEKDFFLSRFLLTVAFHGADFPSKALRSTALALELLDEALWQGYLTQAGTNFSEISLISSDYFYAQALNQVIILNIPTVIDILARAIADTAAAWGSCLGKVFSYREKLILAAFNLGVLLGKSSSEATTFFAQVSGFPWLRFPEGLSYGYLYKIINQSLDQ